MTAGNAREAGFTLVETLVAFTILSAAIIVSFQIFNSGLRHQAAVTELEAIMELARAELGKLALQPALEDGVFTGHAAAGDWQISVRQLKDHDRAQTDSSLHPFHVTFRMKKAGGTPDNAVILDTLLLAQKKMR